MKVFNFQHSMILLCVFSLFGVACLSVPHPSQNNQLTSNIESHSQKESLPINDPYVWLEEIESKRALDWVRSQNEESLNQLTRDPRYLSLENDIRAILLAKDRIPYPSIHGNWVYNFWQDEISVRGLWRRTPLKEYQKKNIVWETLIDFDGLANRENENWVFKRATCLEPHRSRCLVRLSRGGKDAIVIREFDLGTREFVANGFNLDEAKSRIDWVDKDTVIVGTDFGPGTLTKAGYPRIVKMWHRGTPLAQAKNLFEGQIDDTSVSIDVSLRPEAVHAFITRWISRYDSETYLVAEKETLFRIPHPRDAIIHAVFQNQLLLQLRSQWVLGGKVFPSGALLAIPMTQIKEPKIENYVTVLFVPDARSTVQGLSTSQDAVFVSLLENVKSKLLCLSYTANKGWTKRILNLPTTGAINVVSTSDFDSHLALTYEDYITPPTLYFDSSGEAKTFSVLKQQPKRFKADGLVVVQYETLSADGTKIPYFVVMPKKVNRNGENRTLLYGYGGFEISETPFYSGPIGKVWLEGGGIYVVANIRGGGEFGPQWHQAALKENRQKSYDDFIAVAEDLIRRKLTSPAYLAIEGGSNGGLLVGATFVQRPELFKAVVCQVPLLDMLRYHKLLAGHSWVGEYGDPDDPRVGAAIAKYSPYQNVKSQKKYPDLFFLTSTLDDRVHPGHARKMVARMKEYGHSVLYYENIEGGHGAAANLEQKVKRLSLEFTFLAQKLGK